MSAERYHPGPLAGHHYDGHTGMLRELTGSPSSYMLLASEPLSIIHVSTHVSLREAIDRAIQKLPIKARFIAREEAL